MKKVVVIFLSLIMLIMPLAGCGEKEETRVLRICNCEDYIDESILEIFEEEYNVKIEYSTFGTLENLYNDIKITPDRYDLVCPSDYMIEKMAKEGMLQKISFEEGGNFDLYASPYIKETFSNIKWQENGETVSLADYGVGYMWGTLGLVFNSEKVDCEDMDTWASLWDAKYKNKSTIKDSIRDSYFMGNAYANLEELTILAEQFNNEEITLDFYQDELKRIFNDTSKVNVEKVEDCLKTLKSNIYGFEVDSGKNDIASGKITINFAWSGDAVYAMDEAETQGMELCYTVPKEGSNVWFDGWCVPKNSKNADLAIKFVEFLSDPEIAIINMDYIGYTSCVAGEDVFNNAVSNYGVTTLVQSELSKSDYDDLDEEEQSEYEVDNNDIVYEYAYALDEGLIDKEDCTANVYIINEDGDYVQEKIEVYEVDLSYFFGDGEWTIWTDTLGRQFSAQYPDMDIINRCAVMNCYDEEANSRVNLMWERVKGFAFSTQVIILLFVLIVLFIVLLMIYKNREVLFKNCKREPKDSRRRRKYKVVKIEKM